MKDAYYFTHDSNARNDARIVSMMSIYGYEGYGRYWALVEFLREQDGYKFKISGKYGYSVLADLLRLDLEKTKDFIVDCIQEFELFQQENGLIWSESLLRRMQIKDAKSQKARESALKRWEKHKDADAMPTHSERNAKKEKKEEERIKRIGPFLDMSLEFHQQQKKAGLQHTAFKDELTLESKLIIDGADILEKIHRLDGEPKQSILKILVYVLDNEFWKPNVVSLAGLRDKKGGNTKYFKIANSMLRDQANQKSKLSDFRKDATGFPMGYCAKCGERSNYPKNQSPNQWQSECHGAKVLPKKP